jgi:hypothetical protein
MKLSEEIHFMQDVVLHPLLNDGAQIYLILSFYHNQFIFRIRSASCLKFCELVIQVAKDRVDVPQQFSIQLFNLDSKQAVKRFTGL